MKIVSNNKTANILMLVAFGLIVIVMLSSFIKRVIIAPPVDSKIEEVANSS